MLELSTDLVRRALFVESKNGESSIFNVVYDYKDGSQEEMLVKVQRSDKFSDGRFNFFEAVEVSECLLNDEIVYFSELMGSAAGDVFKLDKDGSYVNEGDWGRSVATLVRDDARIFTSYILLLDKLYFNISALLHEDKVFAKLSKVERDEKVEQAKEIIKRDAYAAAMSDDSIERVADQIKMDNDMISAFPDWVPEYDSGELFL